MRVYWYLNDSLAFDERARLCLAHRYQLALSQNKETKTAQPITILFPTWMSSMIERIKTCKQRDGIRRDRVNEQNNVKQHKTNETTLNDAEALKNRQR